MGAASAAARPATIELTTVVDCAFGGEPKKIHSKASEHQRAVAGQSRMSAEQSPRIFPMFVRRFVCAMTENASTKSRHTRACLVLPVRIELTTSPLPRGCSTTELRQRQAGCENRPMGKGRERDPCHTARHGASTRPPKITQRKASVACPRVVILHPWTSGESVRRR